MKNSIFSSLRSMVKWVRFARRTQKACPGVPWEQPISPEQLRRALAEMLDDPESKRLLLRSLVGSVLPIQGGMACTTFATTIGHGDFGSQCNPADTGNYSFSNSSVGIGTTSPQFSLHVLSSATADIVGEGYANGGGRFIGRMAHGSAGAPTAVQANDILATFAGRGYGSTGFSSNRGIAQVQAAQNWTDAAQGAFLSFQTTLIGSATIFERMRIADNGNVGIGTTDRLSTLTVKGRASFPATGSVTVSGGSPSTVTGSGTFFTTQVGIGDRVTITTSAGGETRTVTAIASDTSLSVDPRFGGTTATAQIMTVLPSIFRADDSSGVPRLTVADNGNVSLSQKVGVGVADRLCRLTVRGLGSFNPPGSVSVTSTAPTTVTGVGTHFTTVLGLGDRIQIYTTVGAETRTVVRYDVNNPDTVLFVDSPFLGVITQQGSWLVFPSIFRVDDYAGNPRLLAFYDGSFNQIVFLHPGGGAMPNDDGNMINTAIANLIAANANGGIIYLMAGVYNVVTPISISVNGVKLRGYGGAQPALSGSPATKLFWAGGAGGKVISAGTGIQDVEISDLEIDGNGGSAGVGLNVDGVVNSRFKNLSIYNVSYSSGIGLNLFVTTSATLSWNVFEGISIYSAWEGVVLDSSRGSGVANPAHNTFIGLNIQSIANFGIVLGDCDNNSFHDVLTPGPIGTYAGAVAGVVADLALGAPGPQPWARSNYFYHLQAGGQKGLVGINASDPTTPPYSQPKNLVFGYDYANGEDQPRVYSSSDFSTPVTNNPINAYFFWIDSSGSVN